MSTNNIKHIRERLGLSQTKLAAAIGVSQGNITHYERHRQEVSPGVARRLIAVAHERGIHLTFDDIYAVDSASHPRENPNNPAAPTNGAAKPETVHE